MSILLIQGPHLFPVQGASATTRPTAMLAATARAAGKALVVRSCRSIGELIECLRQARQPDTEMVLLDSGDLQREDCLRQGAELCRALDALASPYIEVHDDSQQVLDLQVHPRNAPIVTVVLNDDLAGSYSLALAIALRRLRPGPAASATLVPL